MARLCRVTVAECLSVGLRIEEKIHREDMVTQIGPVERDVDLLIEIAYLGPPRTSLTWCDAHPNKNAILVVSGHRTPVGITQVKKDLIPGNPR